MLTIKTLPMSRKNSLYKAANTIKEKIDLNPFDRKDASHLAAEEHVSRNKVSPVFKEITGKTIKRYQLEKLMESACKMLLKGMTIKEVAIECGYPDFKNNFSRSFKSVFGLGPEEWLKKTLITRTDDKLKKTV